MISLELVLFVALTCFDGLGKEGGGKQSLMETGVQPCVATF